MNRSALSRLSSTARGALALHRTSLISRPQLVGARNGILWHVNHQQTRTEASLVSNKPASQSLEQAALNVKEEIGNSAADLAKSIAGGNMTADATTESTTGTFLGVTSSMATAVPKPVLIVGLAGAIPYIGCSGATVYAAYQAGLAAAGQLPSIDPGIAINILDQALTIQTTYGAVMLSFLGALHWGMEFAQYGGQKGYSRLMLGVAPALFAWPTLALQPTMALTAQWLGFTALWYADSKATGYGWTPKWYSQYRFYLSILVGTCIIGSLAGTSYWGPVAGHGFSTHELDLVRDQRKALLPYKTGKTGGDIEALPAGEAAAGYVLVKKKTKPEEEKKEQKNAEQEEKK